MGRRLDRNCDLRGTLGMGSFNAVNPITKRNTNYEHENETQKGAVSLNVIHVASLGAGVQSSTMVLRAAHGEITPMPVVAIFADTQDEPKAVYEWLDWLEKQLPFPVARVTKGSLSKWALRTYWSRQNKKMTVMGMPFYKQDGMFMRQCSSEFKHDPISKEITKWMRKHHVKKAIKWLGISSDEIYRIKPSRRKSVEHRYPLVEDRINRHECVAWMLSHGYRVPPKSSCIYCPYRSDAQFRQLRADEPESFAKAVQFEKDIQAQYAKIGLPKAFIHKTLVPLDEVDFSTDIERGQQELFGNECEGHCGT